MLRPTWPEACDGAAGRVRRAFGWAFALLLLAAAARASAAPFDLAGPTLEVRVTRAGRTLPIAEAPTLAAGDQISVKADLPPGESVHYLLVTAFLRGATNPPPESWFARTAAWKPQGRNGLRVTVPQGAEQALVFLAPQAGGDFKTLVDAVRARPGAFVRASQELGQASLDRSRLDAFTAAVARINEADPQRLKTASPLLARSLGIRIDDACLKKVSEVQASCLTQDSDALVLANAQSTSRLASLASGYSAELARELSSTPWAGAGNYSPYVASLIDIVHLLDASRTAQYQYIPALGVATDQRLSLLLNAPPSFHNPQSVLVVSLPAIGPETPPTLHPLDADAAYCATRPDLLLPMDGAPLLFSGGYAHDLVLRLGAGKDHLDLAARADPERGGVAVDVRPARTWSGSASEGVLAGAWGFSPFVGPKFHVVTARPQTWMADGAARPSLTIGKESIVRLDGRETACVESVGLKEPSGAEVPLAWSAVTANQLSIKLPPKPAGAGDFKLLIHAYGAPAPDVVQLGLYSQPAVISAVTYHQGDREAALSGERLDEVKSVTLGGVAFAPAAGSGGDDARREVSAADGAALDRLGSGEPLDGQAVLEDGRVIPIHTTVAPPRPRVGLISKDVEAEDGASGLPIKLVDPDVIPRSSRLTFSIRADGPMRLTERETLEVQTADGGFSTRLTAADGLMLQDARVAVASLDLARRFGGSAFGPLQFRLVKDGVAGDWTPLGVLVRLPQVSGVGCAAGAGAGCTLKGAHLFLIAAVSASPDFASPVVVPDGFARAELKVPRPHGGRLYLKLRDDPAAIAVLTTGAGTERARAARPDRTAPAAAKPPRPDAKGRGA